MSKWKRGIFTGTSISESGGFPREISYVKDVSYHVMMKDRANVSNHGKVRFHHVVERFNPTWYTTKEGRDGFIRRKAWIPH
jgi:hypothetical protein